MKNYTLKNSLRILVITLVLSILIGSVSYATRSKSITVTIDGVSQTLKTPEKTVGKALEEIERQLPPRTEMNYSNDDPVVDYMNIEITTFVAVNLRYRGIDSTEITASRTVEELLTELDIVFDEDDLLTPEKGTPLEEGLAVQLDILHSEEKVSPQEIPYEKTTVKDEDMYEDEKKVTTKGVPGSKEITTLYTYKNDELLSEEVVGEKITLEPVTEVTTLGTKERPKTTSSSSTSRNLKNAKSIVMEATAYDPSAGTQTASGMRARVGVVAVDPKVIPLGTNLYIESLDGWSDYGYAVAGDTGGAIKGNRIDLFFNSSSTAWKFGRRDVRVYVLD